MRAQRGSPWRILPPILSKTDSKGAGLPQSDSLTRMLRRFASKLCTKNDLQTPPLVTPETSVQLVGTSFSIQTLIWIDARI